jgi:thymidylate kinase
MMPPFSLRAGSLIVLEGLDRSGKSTQRSRLAGLNWSEPKPVFTHMPSGLSALTREIYALTETEQITSPLARQLLHLACHAENMNALTVARRRGLVLDRWWWSTVAYGWYAGRLADAGVSTDIFFGLIDMVWHKQPADVVFLFMTPFEKDELNRNEVQHGYESLADRYSDITISVPVTTPEETNDFLCTELRARRLLEG